jgi:hypothetical protein
MGGFLFRLRTALTTWGAAPRVIVAVFAMVGTLIAAERAVFAGYHPSWLGDVELMVGILGFMLSAALLRRATPRRLWVVALILSVFPVVAAVRVNPLFVLALPSTVLWPVSTTVLYDEDPIRRPRAKVRPERVG